MKPDTYFARLTWNTKGWRCPSGHIVRTERGTYVAKHGFGHEEWLNRTEWTVDGWRYGYVEGIARSRNLTGRKIRLALFSINPKRERLFIGEIRAAEVLTPEQAMAAYREFKRCGWIRTMIRELEDVVGRSKKFRRDSRMPSSIMNIRFRPSSIRIDDAPRKVPRRHVLRKFSRYAVMKAPAISERQYDAATRRAMKGLKSTGVRKRRGTKSTEFDPIEDRMENEVRQILESRFGRAAVDAQKDYVDLQVRTGNRKILIELKSAARARTAIRDAMGQLLDYAFFRDGNSIPRLMIVGRGQLRPEDKRFLKTLRGRFRIPVEYRQYDLGSGRFEL